jgi:SAM-dependent methyltransferase
VIATDPDLLRRVPALLSRARALLRLKGGPSDRLGPGELQPAARAVEALHLGLVGERQLASSSTYDAAAHLGAYLLWWWPQSYAKVRAALALAPPAVPRAGPLRILDLGAGPGPAALSLIDLFAGRGMAVEATAADASAAALAEAVALGGAALRTEQVDLSAGAARAQGPFDLICAAHLLSELPGGAAERALLVRRLAGLLAPGGRLLLLEPALRETGRALLELRDLLLSPGAEAPLRALGPCLTQRPCPALQHPRDWCTAEQPWTPPPHLLQLGRELGLHPEAPLHLAALVLGRAAPAPPPDLFRVVGLPQPEKGKRRLFVCNDAGRQPVVLLDRQQRPGNAALAELGRGALVRLTGLTAKGDGLRLSEESQVEPQE